MSAYFCPGLETNADNFVSLKYMIFWWGLLWFQVCTVVMLSPCWVRVNSQPVTVRLRGGTQLQQNTIIRMSETKTDIKTLTRYSPQTGGTPSQEPCLVKVPGHCSGRYQGCNLLEEGSGTLHRWYLLDSWERLHSYYSFFLLFLPWTPCAQPPLTRYRSRS